MEPELDEAIALGPLFIEAIALFRDSIRAYADGDVDARADACMSAIARSIK